MTASATPAVGPQSEARTSDAKRARLAAIDRLVTIDLPRRGVIDTIAPLARARFGPATAGMAAELLIDRTKPGEVVLIATGWLDRPHISTAVAESDGPPGAAVLARALHVGLGLIPFILVESELVDAMTQVMHAAGLRCLSPDEAVRAQTSTSALHAAAIIALPKDWDAAAASASDLLARFDIGAFVAIEKGGANSAGRIHTSRGADTTTTTAKADAVLTACTDADIPTVGIGDGGNEIGMGSIGDTLAAVLRFGEDCGCGCGGGVVPANSTDVLVAAAVSNWGAYAVVTALAVLLDRGDLLHTPDAETAVLEACRSAGLIDGASGFTTASADGLDANLHRRMITLLRAVAGDGVDATIWATPQPPQTLTDESEQHR
ncbi:MAG: glutamate cyclase domain-containing protein [Nitriliruptoraceae bacterium]